MTYVLVHSPLVGPSTWSLVAERLEGVFPSLAEIAAAPRPRWRRAVDIVVDAARDLDDVVLVGHSGAGALLPPIGKALGGRVSTYVFVDATLPSVPANEESRRRLEALAVDGVLPPWSEWFGPGVMKELVPDPIVRARIEADMPRLPLDYFDDHIPEPDAWDSAPCVYIQFSPIYDPIAAEARRRGMHVELVAGGHLHMVVAPDVVAATIERLAHGNVAR